VTAGAPDTIIQRRIAIAAGLCVMAFALIGLRLVDVMAFKGRVTGAGATLQDRLAGARADILDRNGALLARDLPVYDLYARPHAFWDKNEAAHDLAVTTGAAEGRLDRVFASSHDYALVARELTPDTQDRVMHLGLPGLEFEAAAKRYYPEGDAAAQVLGMTEPGGKGIAGLELGLNDRLANAQPGASVALSLDMRIQYALSHEVEQAREEFTAKAAGGIVLDVRTGEILAMASLPESADGAPIGVDPHRNRMAQDVYELGSVFKIFSFSLAVEDHTTRMDEVFRVGSGFKLGRLRSTMPSTCRPKWPRAISWPNLPTRARRRSRCVPDRTGSAHSWAALVARGGAFGIAGKRRTAYSAPLGPDRNGDGRVRARHFRQSARLRHRGGHRR
jgi:cell division protein FtsI (penicillin-binding protein 3)